MGKKRRPRKKPSATAVVAAAAAAATTSSTSGSSKSILVSAEDRHSTPPSPLLPAVLQRLRHADVAIREATIHGLLSSSSSSSSSSLSAATSCHYRPRAPMTTTMSTRPRLLLNFAILQELRNQVVNGSALAATCLIPYLSSTTTTTRGTNDDNDHNKNNNNEQPQRIASWWSTFHHVVVTQVTALLLFTKKQQARNEPTSLPSSSSSSSSSAMAAAESTTTTTTTAAAASPTSPTTAAAATPARRPLPTQKKYDPLANANDEMSPLLLECLKCCTALVENNPFVRNVEDGADIFWQVLVLASSLSSSSSSCRPPPSSSTTSTAGSGDAATTATMTTTTTMTATSTTTTLVMMMEECSTYAARILHAMSETKPDLWPSTSSIDPSTMTLLLTTMMDATVRGLHLLGTIHNCRRYGDHVPLVDLGGWYNVIATALQSLGAATVDVVDDELTVLCDRYERYVSAQHDWSLEDQVIRTQRVKREPARHIARRLKKEQQSATTAMMDVDGHDHNSESNHDGVRIGEEQDQKEGKVAADLVRHSGKITADREDDAEAAWWHAVAEWEARLEPVELALEILANMTLQDDDRTHMIDDSTTATMIEEQQQHRQPVVITDDIVVSLEQLLGQLHRVSSPPMILPPVIQDSITAVQNTAAVCTGNLLCSLAAPTTTTATGSSFTGQGNTTTERLWTGLRQLSPKTAPILSAQMLVMKTHGLCYRLESIQPYIQLIESCTDEDVVREVIPLVVLVLTREPHDGVSNRAVAHALLCCPVSTGSVVAERLNAIMDLYGDDDDNDCRTDIFNELNLLDFVKSQRKVLKERISIGSLGGCSANVDEEEIVSWKEAAENAAAFVKYKLDQKKNAMEM